MPGKFNLHLSLSLSLALSLSLVRAAFRKQQGAIAQSLRASRSTISSQPQQWGPFQAPLGILLFF